MKSNALVMTNHLVQFAGSEVLAIEVSEALLEMNHNVDLLSNNISQEVKNSIDNNINVYTEVDNIEWKDYNIIWSQHGMLPLIFNRIKENITLSESTRIISAHLSPYEPFEHIGLLPAKILGATLVANSEETINKLGQCGVDPKSIINFKNAAPKKFINKKQSKNENLNRLLIVSNHLPAEISDAILELDRIGVTVSHIGLGGHHQRRLSPSDIEWSDAVLTIGKTTQYALLGNRPVYCYDRFGGPGWVKVENFDKAERFNFSGRCCGLKKDYKKIVNELIKDYIIARSQIHEIHNRIKEEYCLDIFLRTLVSNKSPPKAKFVDIGKLTEETLMSSAIIVKRLSSSGDEIQKIKNSRKRRGLKSWKILNKMKSLIKRIGKIFR